MTIAVEVAQEEVMVEDIPMVETEVGTKVVDQTVDLEDTKVEDREATEVDKEDMEAVTVVLLVVTAEVVETVCPTWVKVSSNKLGTCLRSRDSRSLSTKKPNQLETEQTLKSRLSEQRNK